MAPHAPLEIRLWRQVDAPDESSCWIWTGALNGNGYGRVHVARGVSRYVHRLAYERLVGPIPDGMVLDHLCRNRACCNPAHLEPVTPGENVRRGVGITVAHSEGRDCGSQGCNNCRRFRSVAA